MQANLSRTDRSGGRLFKNKMMGSNNTAYVEKGVDGKAAISQLISKPNVYEVRHVVVCCCDVMCLTALVLFGFDLCCVV